MTESTSMVARHLRAGSGNSEGKINSRGSEKSLGVDGTLLFCDSCYYTTVYISQNSLKHHNQASFEGSWKKWVVRVVRFFTLKEESQISY